MFAKLKQKIQDEQGELKFDFTKGLAVATATNQLNNFQPKFSQSEETPAILDMKSNMTSKESEGSVEKLRKYLKGRREEEILERLLEKQQDDFTKQLNEATKDYVARLKMLEKEKSELKIEATMWKDMYFNDHEAAQEVEGFQAHELTKLKQTVLAYQKDLQDYRTNLQQTEACLKETRERFFNLEEETDGLKMKCDVLEEESIRLKENCAKSNASINDFKDVKDNLTRKVMELNFLLEENEKKFNKLEEMLSTIQHDYDTLKHNHEMYQKRTEVMIEEKDDTISHLQERILILERRLEDSLLGDDERVNALMMERDSFEMKLDENRQHLNEMKRNWSEKVLCLEKQIVHLNIKMAEDREEGLKNQNVALKSKLSELLNTVEEMHNLNAWLTTESDHDKEEYETRTAELHCKIKHVYKIKQDMSHLLEEGITDVNAEKMEQEEKTVVKKEISTILDNDLMK